jgi:hypothetical protein
MPKTPKIDFSDVKQDRSKKTLDDLLQAAYEIVEAADPKLFTSRTLATKSGYSLGTLSQRLGSIEDVFFWAIQKGRDNNLSAYIKEMKQFDPKSNVYEFVETFVDKAFAKINLATSAVVKFHDQKLVRKYGVINELFEYIDVLNAPYLELCSINESNTFRTLSLDEVRLIFRSSLMLMEKPFVLGDPIAGSEEHRRIAITAITGMLAR